MCAKQQLLDARILKLTVSIRSEILKEAKSPTKYHVLLIKPRKTLQTIHLHLIRRTLKAFVINLGVLVINSDELKLSKSNN